MEQVVKDGFITAENSTENLAFEFSDYSQRVLVATLYLIASVLGICGNSLVVLAVLLSKKLRTTTNAFVVNLSVADLLTSLVIPWNAVTLLDRGDGLPVSEWICSVVSAIQTITVGCSIYTLASIGLQRLLLITRPMTIYRVIYTPIKIASWLVATWLIPLLVTLIPPLMGVGELGYNPKYHHCGFKSSNLYSSYYNSIVAGALYPAPFFIIIVCYILIWMYLNRHAKRMVGPPEKSNESLGISLETKSMSSVRASQSELNLSPARAGTINSSRMYRRQNEITKNMFYVVCAFVLLLTPFAVCLFYEYSDPALPYASVTLVFNSCVNPLIYATKHRDFKTVFGGILRRRWDSIPQPSDFLKVMRRNKCCGDSDSNAWS